MDIGLYMKMCIGLYSFMKSFHRDFFGNIPRIVDFKKNNLQSDKNIFALFNSLRNYRFIGYSQAFLSVYENGHLQSKLNHKSFRSNYTKQKKFQ